jgi:fructosamine-3-kinase
LAQRVAQSIGDALQLHFEPTGTERVGGGCIHEAWKLTGEAPQGTRHFFAKVNRRESLPMFNAEAEGLRALREARCIRVPRVIACEDDGDEQAWLAMEWLVLEPLQSASAAALGTALAAQHRLPQSHFGWAHDNFIGASPQVNGHANDWLGFWREKRLVAQLRMAAANGSPPIARRSSAITRPRAHCCMATSGAAMRRRCLTARRWSSTPRCTWATASATSR